MHHCVSVSHFHHRVLEVAWYLLLDKCGAIHPQAKEDLSLCMLCNIYSTSPYEILMHI